MAREKGVVKWFSTEKGYGFVRRDSGEEIFVHHSDIEVEGYASLKNGEAVEFEVFQSDRGPKARKLVPLGEDGDASGAGPIEPGRTKASSHRTRNRTTEPARNRRAAGKPAGSAKADGGPADSASSSSGRKSIAAQLKERLGGRFPGFGG